MEQKRRNSPEGKICRIFQVFSLINRNFVWLELVVFATQRYIRIVSTKITTWNGHKTMKSCEDWRLHTEPTSKWALLPTLVIIIIWHLSQNEKLNMIFVVRFCICVYNYRNCEHGRIPHICKIINITVFFTFRFYIHNGMNKAAFTDLFIVATDFMHSGTADCQRPLIDWLILPRT